MKTLTIIFFSLFFFTHVSSQDQWKEVFPLHNGRKMVKDCGIVFDQHGNYYISGNDSTGPFSISSFTDRHNAQGIIPLFNGATCYFNTSSFAIDQTDSIVFCYTYDNVRIRKAGQNSGITVLPFAADRVVVNKANNDKWFVGLGLGLNVVKYSSVTGDTTVYPPSVTGFSTYPSDMIADISGNLYFLEPAQNTLYKFDGGSWTQFSSANGLLPTGYFFYALAADSLNNVFLTGYDFAGTHTLLCKLSGTSITTISTFSNTYINPFFSIACDYNNNLWLLSEEHLTKITNNSEIFIYPHSIDLTISNSQVYIDRLGVPWISFVKNISGVNRAGFLTFDEYGFTTIKGTVYNDINLNGTRDSTEPGLPNMLISSAQNFTTLTDALGDYELFFFDSLVTNTISHQLKPYYIQTSSPLNYSITPSTQQTSNIDFGVALIPNIIDVGVNLMPLGVTPGFSSIFYLAYSNYGTSTIASDTIELEYDTAFTFLSATIPPISVANNTIKWAYQNLSHNFNEEIILDFYASPALQLTDTISFTAKIFPIIGDTVPSNNINDLNVTVTGSFDPNAKDCFPKETTVTNDWIYYTIYFQNTGTDTAFNVFVLDTLDQNLQLNTFEFLGSSHACNVQMMGSGYLRFNFSNILLPDSNINEPLSHGFINYRVKSNAGLLTGTQILNTAYIYFDFNAAVVTNTTQTIIVQQTPAFNIDKTIFNIYTAPNPANTSFIISLPNFTKPTIASLSDLTGRTISQFQITSAKQSVNVSNLKSGLYFLMVDDVVKKVIVE